MPFVLNPESALYKSGDEYQNSDPQYFTYKNSQKYMWSGLGRLNFCPSTYKKHFDSDISYKLLYQQGTKTSVTFNSMLNTLPGIQIREFIPDTALDQCINFFVDLIKEVMTLFGDNGIQIEEKTKPANNEKLDATNNISSIFDKLKNVTWFVMKYITGNTKPNNIITDTAGGTEKSRFYTGNSQQAQKILDFPYMLYYKLQSCTTTGIYEIPAIPSGKQMYQSDGYPGWKQDGLRLLPPHLSKLPGGINDILGKMFGNVGFSWMPWWNAEDGNATLPPEVVIEFDLVNDTADSALMNFIFVNNIVPNNKWIQYGLFQHSSHLYDVKLEGYDRLFACTGKFEVIANGVIREPPLNWYESNGPLAKHINANLDTARFLTGLKTDKSIKIPDVYHVKLAFNSLLPSNFNQYLYTLTNNTNSIDTYYTHTYDHSAIVDMLTGGIKGIINGAKFAFENKVDYTKNNNFTMSIKKDSNGG